MTIRVGTSGWVYNHWRGVFYPEELKPREWFRFYASEFDTVEINNSFYRLPSAETFDAWREQAPARFICAVKASRYLTHLKRLKDPEEPLQTFFEHADHLRGRLGPVLYQLPPRWKADLPRLEHFLSILPKGHRHVVEFRDQSWFSEEAFQLLQRFGVAHCIHDMRPLSVPLRVTAAPVYIRFHGDPEHGGDYQPGALKTWAERMSDWHKQGLDVFAYFNNDPYGYAIQNARSLKVLLGVSQTGAHS